MPWTSGEDRAGEPESRGAGERSDREMKAEGRPARSSGREGWAQNLLLWASDVRFLERSAGDWSAHWGGGEEAVVLSAPDTDPAVFETEVRSLPMWRERQVVRLRHAERASPKLVEALSSYFERPSSGTALLVEYTGELKREKEVPAAWKGILERIDSRDCSPRGAAAYIRARAASEGFEVRPDAVEALEEWACGEMGRLVSALDLLFLYRASEKSVSVSDMESLLGAGGTPKMWDLQDAFLQGDRQKFMSLVGGIERDREASALAFLGMVAKQVRGLLLYRGLKSRGKKDSEITFRELGLGSPYPAQKLMKVAGRWPEERVRPALGALFQLDLALKSKPKDADEWSLLEQALLKLL
jgi:DNA polymerase III subunit delta